MATNPVGKGSKTIGINMPQEMANDLKSRAESMGMSISSYCKIIFGQWIESGQEISPDQMGAARRRKDDPVRASPPEDGLAWDVLKKFLR